MHGRIHLHPAPQQKSQTPGARKSPRKRRMTPARLGRTTRQPDRTASGRSGLDWAIFGLEGSRGAPGLSLTSRISLSRKNRSSERRSGRAAQPQTGAGVVHRAVLALVGGRRRCERSKAGTFERINSLNGQSRRSSRDRRKPVWLLRVKRKTRSNNTWRSCCNGCAAMHRAVRLQRHNLREVRLTRRSEQPGSLDRAPQRRWPYHRRQVSRTVR